MDQDQAEGFPAVRDTLIQPDTAIVAEGGGQRGIYTAGVLDAFLAAGFNPFELAIGASAGAQNLSSYIVGLPGYARRAIAELSVSPGILVPYRWMGRRSVLDLDLYFSRLSEDPDYRFPSDRIDRIVGRRRLVLVATGKSDLRPRYLEPDSSTLLLHMKASSAVPFLYRKGVEVNDDILVDGGVADPIPVRRAHALGARRILVIRTLPADELNSCWRQRLRLAGIERVMPGAMADMLACHEQGYAEAMAFLQRPPVDVQLVQIAPSEPLQSQVFGSRSEALLADYNHGYRTGESALEQLREVFTAPMRSVSVGCHA